MVSLYRFNLALIVGLYLAAFWVAGTSFSSMSPGMDNGGAFLAALGMGAILAVFAVATPLAWFSAAVSFIWQESMPDSFLYHFTVPVFLASPGTCLLVAAAWSSV